MSDKPISVGDLVMVVRGHACVVQYLGGIPWTVDEIVTQKGGGWQCGKCGGRNIYPHGLLAAQNDHFTIPLDFLKRIPPLSELEGEKRDEEITA